MYAYLLKTHGVISQFCFCLSHLNQSDGYMHTLTKFLHKTCKISMTLYGQIIMLLLWSRMGNDIHAHPKCWAVDAKVGRAHDAALRARRQPAWELVISSHRSCAYKAPPTSSFPSTTNSTVDMSRLVLCVILASLVPGELSLALCTPQLMWNRLYVYV